MSTTVTGSDGLTYTLDGTTLTITGTGVMSSMQYGSVGGTSFASMTKCIIGEGITKIATSGTDGAFRNITNLTEIVFPTTLTEIETVAFLDCTSLNHVVFPPNVATLSGYAIFAGCTSMTDITFMGNAPSLGQLVFSVGGTGTVTVKSNGWASSSYFTEYVCGSNYTNFTFVTVSPAVYKHLTYNGSKIQVDSAVRDGNGKKIDTNYQSKLVSGTNIKSINGASLLGSGDMTAVTAITLAGNPLTNNNGTVNIGAASSYGLFVYGGALWIAAASDSVITNRHTSGIGIERQYQPITPIHLDHAIVQGLTTNENTLTDAQKSTATSWLGAQSELITSTITIATTDWSANACTKSVTGVTATSKVWVSPDDGYESIYANAGVKAKTLGSGTITFNCTTTPSSAINVNVVIG